jgi:hypothetical protein
MIIGQDYFVASSLSQSRTEGPERQMEQSSNAMSRLTSGLLERIWIVPVVVLQSQKKTENDR